MPAWWDKLTGTHRPADGVVPQSPETLRAALLAVAGPDSPFTVRAGTADEGVDLVAEWDLGDERWVRRFGRETTTTALRILMRLDAEAHEVRNVDEARTVERHAGGLRWGAAIERGNVNKTRKGYRLKRGPDGKLGLEQEWSVSTDELKDPLRDAATTNGWTWRTVPFGKVRR